MATKLDTKIENWKNKLLDLGKRNKLLNFKELKRATIKFESPDMNSLWESFVVDETPIEFPYTDDFGDNTENTEQIALYDEPDFNKLKTHLSIGDLQKSLRNLRDKSKTAMEEQGINVLYLSFGMLKWAEVDSSDQYFKAPIILVPATLTVESITSPYILNIHEDEIVVNPTLNYKLQNDFGITLPEFDEDENIEVYLTKVRELISKNKWEVLDETWLSLLSFLKINMYNDLQKHKDRVMNNLNVRTIAGDASASNIIPQDILNFDFDEKLSPKEVFQVVDADSSQQDAVLSAKKGYSFVLQGPPGTGKSQTITNIIAECLSDGKKVLFVSEKMAALDVVHRRLHNSGIDDFCLILHSHKANKKEVLSQLGEVLSLAKSKASVRDDAYQKLDNLQMDKEKLNDYADTLHKKISPLNKSVYQINSVLANLESYEDVIFSIDDIKNVDDIKYNKYNFLLDNFVKTIGRMTDDYRKNPWYGCNVNSVTNELRHDIGAKISALLPKIDAYNNEINSLLSGFNLNIVNSYNGLTNFKEILSVAKNSPTIPMNWITGDEILPLFDEVSECERIKNDFELFVDELNRSYIVIKDSINVLNTTTLLNTDKINADIQLIKSHIQSDVYLSALEKLDTIENVNSLVKECKSKVENLYNLEQTLLSEYEKDIFDLDYKAMIMRYKTEYTNIFKFFKGSYGSDKKTLKAISKTLNIKISDDYAIKTLNSLKEISEIKEWFESECDDISDIFSGIFKGYKTDFIKIENVLTFYYHSVKSLELLHRMSEITKDLQAKENTLISHYEFLYNGIDTEWGEIRAALNWAVSFRQLVEKHSINIEFTNKICSEKQTISKCQEAELRLEKIKSDIDVEFNWYLALFDNNNEIKNLRLISLIDKLNACQNGLFLLEEWIDFKSAKTNCIDEGLADYIDKIDSLSIDVSKVIPIFRKRFCRLWLDAILPDYPILLNFRRRNQESLIEEFASLDKLQFEIAKARIRSKLINELPSIDGFTSGVDEISILKRELSKQRKIMPIRKLFRAIPNLLLKLKPCLMMSPLSVSLFLEADTYMFDTIIFDEASQVCTENAIGAISRGKQVIIAGDSKQLPPTNFFGAAISDTDYDDNKDEDDDDYAYESVLDEANLLPERTLLWHYRSRHEHLIAFSNAKIYKNNLVTFPSNVDKVLDNGVEYIYVKDGFYDKGGKKGNVIEAKKVAEMVFEHFKKHPNRSVGVVAFGTVQQQAIDTAIREMRLKTQSFEHFFKEDSDEPFFVKNLENVQGDERDTIIFSIGYAKDINGIFRMNFGPLSKSGGERRLNVAITRAKYNVKLVGSILPTDINTDKISTEGPKLLRNYIDFAMNGVSVLNNAITESDITEHDSPFEKSVYDFLDRKGYKLGTQIGCSGYRIDMAVKHPTLNGQYVLGIECDGAAYHSARTARERDRLRQDVLEGMGWNIYRIWSTDWIKDQKTEGERLLKAIEESLSNYGTSEFLENEIDETPLMDDFVSIDEKVITEEEKQNPYGFEKTEAISFNNLPRNSQGYLSLTDCINEIIRKSFPVHYDLICKELAPLFGNQKATVKIRREVDLALQKMQTTIFRKGDFFYPINYDEILVHIPNTRKINHISTDEIAQVMYEIAAKCTGATKESLCLETSRAFGFNRMTANIEEAMNDGFDVLINKNKIKIVDGKVISS